MVSQHLPHIDDLPLEQDFADGLKLFVEHVDGILEILNNRPSEGDLCLKADGSMCLFFGRDPHCGRFFVSTKSGLSKKNPRRCHSIDEILELYPGDKNSSVRRQLINLFVCLEVELKEAGRQFLVYQADVLWDSPRGLRDDFIDGTHYLLTTPNAVTYGFPKDSPYFDRANKASIGLVVHDAFVPVPGKGLHMILEARDRRPAVELCEVVGSSCLLIPGKIREFKGGAAHSDIEILRHGFTRLKDPFREICGEQGWPRLAGYIKRFLKEHNTIAGPMLFDEWLIRTCEEEMEGLTPHYYNKRREKLDEMLRVSKTLAMGIIWYTLVNIELVKKGLLNLLDQVEEDLPFETFYRIDGVYQKDRGEGFVHFMPLGMGKESQVKIVDKETFTYYHSNHNTKYAT